MRLRRPLIPRKQPKKPAKAPRPSSGQLETGPAVVDIAASCRRSCAPDASEHGGLFAHQCCTTLASLNWCISRHSTSAHDECIRAAVRQCLSPHCVQQRLGILIEMVEDDLVVLDLAKQRPIAYEILAGLPNLVVKRAI